MDTGEESFTMSSFDFNSSFGLCSSSDDDDDDEDNDYANYEQLQQQQQLDKRYKYDIDAYFELELPQAAVAATTPPSAPTRVLGAADEDDDKELEFRISFSAVVPFPGFRPSSINSANIIVSSSKGSCGTCEDANADQLTAANIDSGPQPVEGPTLSCIHQGPIRNYSDVSMFPPGWTRFPLPVDDDYADDCRRVSDINSRGLVRIRKIASPKVNSAAANGGIMKLLVKLRSIIISGLGSMRASLTQGIAIKRCPSKQRVTLMKPFGQWFALCKLSEQQQRRTHARTNGGEMGSSPKVLEMKFEVMRNLFGSAVSPLKYSGSKTKSCPTSIKSSPVHQSEDTSLVHAAIAHCKKSFGQNNDFSF